MALILGWGPVGAMVLAGVTYISSSGIVAKVLSDLGRLGNRETLGQVARIAVASAAAAVLGELVTRGVTHLVGTSTAGSLVTLLIGTVVIGAAALAGTMVARVPELREPLAAVRARFGRG